jgi:hypothetical protein
MSILETIQFVILGLIAAILMWDNRAANQAAPLRVRIRNDHDRRRRH